MKTIIKDSNTASVGTNSNAQGKYTIAHGNYSHAEGHGTTADYIDDEEVISLPYESTDDILNYNPTFGHTGPNTAHGEASHSEGLNTYAYGNGSHAEGKSTTASGEASHTEGYLSEASGQYAHAEGFTCVATGIYSHSEGNHTTVTSNGHGAHAEGNHTLASGQYAHAEGTYTTAEGNNGSHAEGTYSTASGEASHAEGNHTIAEGSYSHASGDTTTANGYASYAIGVDAIAHTNNELAIGSGSDGGVLYQTSLINMNATMFAGDDHCTLTSYNGSRIRVTQGTVACITGTIIHVDSATYTNFSISFVTNLAYLDSDGVYTLNITDTAITRLVDVGGGPEIDSIEISSISIDGSTDHNLIITIYYGSTAVNMCYFSASITVTRLQLLPIGIP